MGGDASKASEELCSAGGLARITQRSAHGFSVCSMVATTSESGMLNTPASPLRYAASHAP